MNSYENELDEIRVKLYEETKGLAKDKIVTLVNTHAEKIAQEFGIKILKETKEPVAKPVNKGNSAGI